MKHAEACIFTCTQLGKYWSDFILHDPKLFSARFEHARSTEHIAEAPARAHSALSKHRTETAKWSQFCFRSVLLQRIVRSRWCFSDVFSRSGVLESRGKESWIMQIGLVLAELCAHEDARQVMGNGMIVGCLAPVVCQLSGMLSASCLVADMSGT